MSEELRAAIRFALARALWSQPEARPEALQLAQQARVGLKGLGRAFAGRVHEVEHWIAEHSRG